MSNKCKEITSIIWNDKLPFQILTKSVHDSEPSLQLLRKETKWNWIEQQNNAWKESKNLQVSSKVHFITLKDLILACDASPYGLGGVLSHKMQDGSERPIGYASRTLMPAEMNCNHDEKEGLAVML